MPVIKGVTISLRKNIPSLFLALVILTTFGIMARAGWRAPCSVVTGVFVVMVSDRLFSHYAFRYKGARNASKILHSFFKGEALRLFCLFIGTVLVLNRPFIEPTAYLIGFVAFIVVSAVARAITFSSGSKVREMSR